MDVTDKYEDSVTKAILKHQPDEDIEEWMLEKAAAYLWWNDYRREDLYYADDEGGKCLAYFVYDVLKWTDQNT